MSRQDEQSDNIAIAVPAPSGSGEIHKLTMAHGRQIGEKCPSTNRAYLKTRNEVELTAEECRSLADTLKLVAEQLEEHHEFAVQIESRGSDE